MNPFLDFQSEFPILNEYTYLNTASSGLLPKQVVEFRQQHDTNLQLKASLFRDTHKSHVVEIKEAVARCMHYKGSRVALVPNFSLGLNLLLEGIPKGQKMLLIEGDYPSINWPVEFRDFEVCYARLDENLEEHIEAAFKKYQPDVFLCSIVQYISGVLIDLDFLKALKSKYPNTLFIGDGTQFFGTRVFNFETSAFDVVGASCYKWMLSGYGNGFFMLKEGVEEKIFPNAIGFNSADAVFGNREKVTIVGKLEPGHQDTLNYGSLKVAIELLERMGVTAIENYLREFSEVLKKRLQEHNLLAPSTELRKQHSTIFNIDANRFDFEELRANNIIASQRGKGIRVSFHWYNGVNDLEKLLGFLKP